VEIEYKIENGNIIPVDFTTKGLMPGALSNVKLRQEWAEAQKVGVDFSVVQFDKFCI
jgi:hypothetical protein